MMFFGSAKALIEGTFHILVLALAVYLRRTSESATAIFSPYRVFFLA